MFHRKYRIFLVFLWLLLIPTNAGAQTNASAVLTPPTLDDFPQISAYLEVFDGSGNFIHDLTTEEVSIIEDQKTIPVNQITELDTGAQFVVALNLGPSMAIRDVNGISRYEVIRENLTNWANQHSNRIDDLSFLTNDGSEHIHLNNNRAWLEGLQTYTTDPRSATPSLDVLVRAINIASDPTPQIGMGQAILLITPPPDRAGTAAIQSLISLAKQERVRVFVWMVSSPAYFTSDGANQLAELANQTGGRFFAFSGEETIPQIRNYLTPLRYVYSIGYESQIRNDTPHRISAQIDWGNVVITSDPQNFELQVLPPNPIFISPPQQIFRANRAALDEALTEETDYTPKEQVIETIIEFPDGRQRSLVRSTLYVDGTIADENTTQPFDQFTWDLMEYTSSGEHALQIEVLDSYGLSNISIPTTVQITVQQTPQSFVSVIAENGPLIAGSAAALAGAVLILVLVRGGRILPGRFGRIRGKTAKTEPTDREKRSDPVTQPVPIGPLPTRRSLPKWMNRLSWPQRQTSVKPIAYLEHIGQENGSKEKIPITTGEITFGKDPILATVTLNDASIEKLHARLRNDSSGKSVLIDEGSIAGTWVNYHPVSPTGTKLSHGDIIHIGRIGLRFMESEQDQIPKPIVIHKEP